MGSRTFTLWGCGIVTSDGCFLSGHIASSLKRGVLQPVSCESQDPEASAVSVKTREPSSVTVLLSHVEAMVLYELIDDRVP